MFKQILLSDRGESFNVNIHASREKEGEDN